MCVVVVVDGNRIARRVVPPRMTEPSRADRDHARKQQRERFDARAVESPEGDRLQHKSE